MEIMKKAPTYSSNRHSSHSTVTLKLGFDRSVKYFEIFASLTKLLKSVG